MTDPSIADAPSPYSPALVATPAPSSTPAKTVPSSAAAARTKMLLESPILPTLLRLAAPNILRLLAFAGVVTFDGFCLGRIGTNARARTCPNWGYTGSHRLKRKTDAFDKNPVIRRRR